MSWESDQDQGTEIKDRSKYLWYVVGVLIVATIGTMLIPEETKTIQSAIFLKQILVTFNTGDLADRARAYDIVVEAREQLVDGVAFKTVAKNYSNDTKSASKGGNVGWMDKGSLVPKIEKYAWDDGNVGKLSGIIETRFGFHVILITERRVTDSDAYEQDLQRRVTEGEAQGGDQP